MCSAKVDVLNVSKLSEAEELEKHPSLQVMLQNIKL
jgi:hypothetical protein